MENTYWNGNGKYQTRADELNKQIPTRGSADKFHIEMWRIVSRLYCDYYNNGFGNWHSLKHWFFELEKYKAVFADVATDEGYSINDIFHVIGEYPDCANVDWVLEYLADIIARWAGGVEVTLRETKKE